ncbi:MAG: alpha/beta fold hydrolase [Candidatus Hydrogenedentes bacterium]|nr:alpha/beta fold hydrolase [Candidatus Hydrogenedentota bacterium]
MTKLITLLVAFSLPLIAFAQETGPYPRITEEAYKARLPFFDYNKDIPLEARIVREWDEDKTLRQKFVFRGAQGFLVPGFIEFPKAAPKPAPLMLLLHGWSGGKDDWWEDGNYVSGGELRKALLDAGYAVLALDAPAHGERSNEIDYMHVNKFEDPDAPEKLAYFTFTEIALQTVKDYRRALDYIAERGDADMARIGILGYSMGGMDAFYLLCVEPRIKMAITCVPPMRALDYGPTAPIDFTWGVKDKTILMLMGTNDDFYEVPRMNATYEAYIKSPNSKLIWYDRDHKLTEIYVPEALAWVKERL